MFKKELTGMFRNATLRQAGKQDKSHYYDYAAHIFQQQHHKLPVHPYHLTKYIQKDYNTQYMKLQELLY